MNKLLDKEQHAFGHWLRSEVSVDDMLIIREQRSVVFLLLCFLLLSGCITVPPEASALSEQIGSRLSDIETAHVHLVEDFFTEKRTRVDEYIESVWVPKFAEEFFDDPANQALWNQVVDSSDPFDRVIFLTMVGPALQKNINTQRQALVGPLDELEGEVTRKIRTEYRNTLAINQSLTAYLTTATELGENRQRYLDKLDLDGARFEDFIDQADTAVAELVQRTDLVRDHVAGVSAYQDSFKNLLTELGLD